MPKLNIKEAEVMDLYVTRLVADKGLREADRAEHGKISHQLQLEFEEACQQALINALPDDKAIELNKKLTADPNFTDAQIEEFFMMALPDSEQVIIDTMAKFRADYLGTTTKDNTATSKNDVAMESNAATAEAKPAETAHAAEPTTTNIKTNEQPNMTNAQNTSTTVPPVGNPVQGTVSEQPGASNVEGVAQTSAVTAEENR